ncbi:MAG: phosphoribosylglycinamide formyltransferase [Bacteroidetes bacterium]|nr:phosphoribosylglycinamide formyltransferase [Bacteroidota bacterium]
MKQDFQKHIAVFASGRGSNAQAIIDHFKSHPSIKVALIVTNKKDAGVIQIAKENRIPFDIVSPAELNNEEELLDMLEIYDIDLIVLAGFLLLIPAFLVKAYPNKIINIHPAILPKYGGKGMYGKHVHEKVLTNKDTESGITIHYVNEHYDEGQYIAQFRCHVEPADTIETLAARIHELEHEHYPKEIEKLLS